MQAAPGHKGPVGAMPQAAYQHGDHNVYISAEFAFAVTAQRDIQVVTQPGGQGDVPPAPEIGKADGGVGVQKVLR